MALSKNIDITRKDLQMIQVLRKSKNHPPPIDRISDRPSIISLFPDCFFAFIMVQRRWISIIASSEKIIFGCLVVVHNNFGASTLLSDEIYRSPVNQTNIKLISQASTALCSRALISVNHQYILRLPMSYIGHFMQLSLRLTYQYVQKISIILENFAKKLFTTTRLRRKLFEV